MTDTSLGSGGAWVSDNVKMIHFGSPSGDQYGIVAKTTLWTKDDDEGEE